MELSHLCILQLLTTSKYHISSSRLAAPTTPSIITTINNSSNTTPISNRCNSLSIQLVGVPCMVGTLQTGHPCHLPQEEQGLAVESSPHPSCTTAAASAHTGAEAVTLLAPSLGRREKRPPQYFCACAANSHTPLCYTPTQLLCGYQHFFTVGSEANTTSNLKQSKTKSPLNNQKWD